MDLASVPGFYADTCSWDWNDPNWAVCNSGQASGEIDLTWKNNHEYSGSSNGTSSQNYGEYSYRTVGASSWSSASLTGTAFGAVANGSGGLGNGKNVTVERIRN